MAGTPKMIIERILRSLIAAIPIAGAGIEQLTFGLKESLESAALQEKVEAMGKEILTLHAEHLAGEDIFRQIVASDLFQETLSTYMAILDERIQTSVALVKSDLSREDSTSRRLAWQIKENQDDIKAMENTIQRLKDEKNALQLELDQVVTAVDLLLHAVSKRKRSFPITRDKLRHLSRVKDMLAACGTALKISLQPAHNLFLSHHLIWEHVSFPGRTVTPAALFFEYILSKDFFTYYLADGEMPDILKLTSVFVKDSSFDRNAFFRGKSITPVQLMQERLRSLTRKAGAQHIPAIASSPELDDAFHTVIESDVSPMGGYDTKRMLKNRYVQLQVLLSIQAFRHETGNELVVLKSGHLLPRLHKQLSEINKGVDFGLQDPITVALACFYIGQSQPLQLLQRFHRLFEQLSPTIASEEFLFTDDHEVLDFLRDLTALKKSVTDFQLDLKERTLSQLQTIQSQQELILEVFGAYYEANAFIESSFLRQITSDPDFFDFDEGIPLA